MSRNAEVVTVREDDRQLVEFYTGYTMIGEIVEDEETPADHLAVIVYVPIIDIIDGTL